MIRKEINARDFFQCWANQRTVACSVAAEPCGNEFTMKFNERLTISAVDICRLVRFITSYVYFIPHICVCHMFHIRPKVAWPIVAKLCHVFDGHPDLYNSVRDFGGPNRQNFSTIFYNFAT